MKRTAFLLAFGLLAAVFAPERGYAAAYKALDRFETVLDLVVAQALSEPKAADLAAAAIDGLLAKYPSEKAAAAKARTGDKAHLDRFGAVFDALAKEKAASPDELAETAIKAMLSHLGPHDYLIGAREYQDMKTQVRGEFGGLGVEVNVTDGVVTVVSPLDGTPAQRGGLLPRDIISAVDGRPTEGLSLSEVVGRMRGKVGSTVALTVLHEGATSPVEIKLVRETIKVGDATYKALGDIGYIRLSQFNERATDSVSAALDGLAAEIGSARLAGFILDLRNNPGGLLDQAVAVADLFLDTGEIAAIHGRDSVDTQRFDAARGEKAGGKPVVVLISAGTASAAEIVAGALRDHRRAKVMGVRSFGKGSVQTIFLLDDGADGALRLTTSEYFTPSGKRVEGAGIEPDIAVDPAVPADLSRLGDETADAALGAAMAHLSGRPVATSTEVAAVSPSAAVVSAPPFDQAVLGKRVALVLGNSAYRHTPALPNPGNDAADVARSLEGLGFAVTLALDLTKQDMDRAFATFARTVQDADAALFYYAGHAMQFDNVNYMMPIDAALEDEASLPYEMARLDDILADMNRSRGVRIAVLDACRNNPLEAKLKQSMARTRGGTVTRGLAPIRRSEGFLVAFATQAGFVAEDGAGRNSPFTAALLDQIETPGLEVGLLFRRVTGAVRTATGGNQSPELLVSLDGEFYFRP